MKNIKIQSLKEVVPTTIRLAVYRKVIRTMNKGGRIANMNSYGLCLTLPCMLWDLESSTDHAPNGEYWSFFDTGIAFPELTEQTIEEIEALTSSEEKEELRLKYLKSWVKQIKDK